MLNAIILNTIIVVIFGVVIGSFLNVCIYRIPIEESIVYPGSHCMACQHPLNRFDLIPILSYLFLCGKCRYCGKKISSRYMLIELLTGLLFGAVYLKFGYSLEGFMYAVFAAVLIVLTMIDYDHMLLPTKIILCGAGVGLVFRVIQAVNNQEINGLVYAVLTALISYGFFYGVFYLAELLLKKEGMGFGDVRLVGMLGIYLSLPLIGLTILIASVSASFYGGILYVIKKTSEPFPFGPFINIGALLTLFFGEVMIGWYLGILGF